MIGGIIAGALGGGARVVEEQAKSEISFNLEQEKARLAEDRALRLDEMKYQRGIQRKAGEASAIESETTAQLEKDAPYGLVSDDAKMQDRPIEEGDRAVIRRNIARQKGFDTTAYDADVKSAEQQTEKKERRDFDERKFSADQANRSEDVKLRKSADSRGWASENRAQESHQLSIKEKTEKKDDQDVLIAAERDAANNPDNASLQKHLADKEREFKRKWGGSESNRYDSRVVSGLGEGDDGLYVIDKQTGSERRVSGKSAPLPGQGQTSAKPSAPPLSFASAREAEAAQKAGQIKRGDIVIIGGRRAVAD